ncbi:MAG: sigma-70 family RNA polymerase sigma factor [Kiritimatiellia bacterium]
MENSTAQDIMVRLTAAQPSLNAFVASVLRDAPDDVPDVVQNTNLAFIRRIGDFDPERPLQPCLIGFAKMQIKAYWTRRQRDRLVFGNAALDALAEAFEDPIADHSPLLERLNHCKRRLAPALRELLLQRYRDGLTPREIARRTHTTSRRVRDNLTHARRKLADCLKRLCPMPTPMLPPPAPADTLASDLLEAPDTPRTAKRLRRALDRDPNLARHYAELALVHHLLLPPTTQPTARKPRATPILKAAILPLAAILSIAAFAATILETIPESPPPETTTLPPLPEAIAQIVTEQKESAMNLKNLAGCASAALVATTLQPAAGAIVPLDSDYTADAIPSLATTTSLAASLPAGGPWYVAPEGNDTDCDGLTRETPFATLERALLEANGNGSGIIYLAPGTYRPATPAPIAGAEDTDTTGFVLTNAIAIVGLGDTPGETIVSRGSGNHRLFYLGHAEARLENLTLTGGIAPNSIGGNLFIDSQGGTVSNCRLLDGYTSAWNSGGGNAALYAGRITRCLVSGGRCSPDTLSAGRRGGSAIWMKGGQVDNSLVTANTNGYAPIVCTGAGTVGNCTIAGNSGTACAGIYVDSAGARVVNTLIAGNTTSSDETGHGHVWRASQDSYASLFSSCLSEVDLNETCLQASDPGFSDAASGDYSLSVASPARDAGETFDAGDWDLSGAARVSNGLVDIGCYEFDASRKSVDFSLDRPQGTFPLTVRFQAFVSGGELEGTVFSWDFNGDGEEELVRTGDSTAEWTYTEAGVHTVTLKAVIGGEAIERTRSECIKTASPVIYVDAAATAPQSPYSTPETALGSIPEALEVAVDGCEIRLLPGVYRQTDPIGVVKAVCLAGQSESPEQVVLTNTVAAGWNRYDQKNLLVANKDALVCNLLLAGGSSFEGKAAAGVHINASGGTVSNCIIRGAAATRLMNTFAAGATIENGLLTHSVVERCTLDPTQSTGSGRRAQAIAVRGGGAVENCLVRDCINSFGSAVLAQESARVRHTTIVHCQVAYDLRSIGNGVNQTNACYGLSVEDSARAENCAVFDIHAIAYNETAAGPAPWGISGAGTLSACAADAEAPDLATNCLVGSAPDAFADYHQGNLLPRIGGILWNKGISGPGDAEGVDLAGNPRLVDNAVDIGCYERFVPPTLILVQ